jgi:hypothetical protein
MNSLMHQQQWPRINPIGQPVNHPNGKCQNDSSIIEFVNAIQNVVIIIPNE